MKTSFYIEHYLKSDIVLVLITSALIYLATSHYQETSVEDEVTIELIPLNIDPDDEIM